MCVCSGTNSDAKPRSSARRPRSPGRMVSSVTKMERPKRIGRRYRAAAPRLPRMARGHLSHTMGLIAYLISLAFIGLILGALARLALPGRDPMSIPQTIMVGIGGALLRGPLGPAPVR